MKNLFTFIILLMAVILNSNAQTHCNPATITNVEREGTGHRINWILPPTGKEVTISQSEDTNENPVGYYDESLGAYHRFTQEHLVSVHGGVLTQIVFKPSFRFTQTEPGHTYTIQIYQGGNWGAEGDRNPGTLVSSQDLNNADLLFNEENTITLETTVTIDATQELWIGYFCTNIDSIHVEMKSPIGCDAGPCNDGFGNIMFIYNKWQTWYEFNYSCTKSWVIKGRVQTIEDVTVNLYFNDEKIKSNILETTFFHDNPIGEEHCYEVEVNCLEGGASQKSNKVCILAECNPPKDLRVSYAAGCSSATLTWEVPENMQGTILYNIYRNDTIIKSNHHATSYEDMDFNPKTAHTWMVKGVCLGGESVPASAAKEACVLGIHKNEKDNIRVYPNPAKNELRITASTSSASNRTLSEVEVEIYDVFGRKLKAECKMQNAEREVVVNVSHLAAGVYFVKIYSDSGYTTKKVIIEN
jgi:hypothetical protein